MKFLLDECIPASALNALKTDGFNAETVLEHLLPESPDTLVASTANQLGAIIVSHDRDFKRLIVRQHDGQLPKYRNAHLIKMECKHRRIADRLKFVMPIISAEFEARKAMKDKRMIIFVGTDFLRVWR